MCYIRICDILNESRAGISKQHIFIITPPRKRNFWGYIGFSLSYGLWASFDFVNKGKGEGF